MDILLLIAWNLYMGANRLPSTRDYWKKSFLFIGTKISDVITRNKFELYQKFLHFAKNNTIDPNSPISKVKYVSSSLIYNYQKFYTLSRNVTIDEKMIKFTGRLKIK